MADSQHVWRFFSAGGFDQVRLDTGADLQRLGTLDQKLWVALSCPTQGLEFDQQTLALIDNDSDGHIRAPELIAALAWATGLLKSADTLIPGASLPLNAIDDSTPDGQRLLASARQILKSLGKAGKSEISVEDTADSVAIFAGMPFNGDGIITEAGIDANLHPTLTDIIDCLGPQTDRSSQPGIDQATVDRFFNEGSALHAWRMAPGNDTALLPLGEASEAAFNALLAVRSKVDDFFTRCQMAAFDPRAGLLLNGAEEDIKALGSRNLATCSDDLAALPIAFVKNGGTLPLTAGLNPAWQNAIAALHTTLIKPLIGECSALDHSAWEDIKARFAGYESWLVSKPVSPLEKLAPERLAEILGSNARSQLSDLIARDAAVAPEAEAIAEVDRLVRYTRDLAKLANNFVAFRDFYTRKDKAVFQAGTLYLDGRSCDLTVKVLDAGKHASLATLSGVYLAYCECSRKGEKMTIAAAFTAGDSDQLMIGRNGVFYDRNGNDWDATISKIIEHPISIRQAFWAPYKKIVRLISEQVQKFAAAKAKAGDEMLAKSLEEAGKKIEPAKASAPAAPSSAFDVGKFAGIFAAVGLAIGAIGTALATVVTGFLGLKGWQMPLALIGLMLLVSGPSMAMAFFKLRNRNLGPILDANGWAVNTRARINIPFGTALTQSARLPDGAERALSDPYAEKQTPWKTYLFMGAILVGGLIYFSQGAT